MPSRYGEEAFVHRRFTGRTETGPGSPLSAQGNHKWHGLPPGIKTFGHIRTWAEWLETLKNQLRQCTRQTADCIR